MILLGHMCMLHFPNMSVGLVGSLASSKGGTKTPSYYISHTSADLACRLKLGTAAEIPQRVETHVTITAVQAEMVTRSRQIAKSGETWGEKKLGLNMNSKTRPGLREPCAFFGTGGRDHKCVWVV